MWSSSGKQLMSEVCGVAIHEELRGLRGGAHERRKKSGATKERRLQGGEIHAPHVEVHHRSGGRRHRTLVVVPPSLAF